MYAIFFHLVLRLLPAELAHQLAARALGALQRSPRLLAKLRSFIAPPRPELAVHALGLPFPGPVGMAAGFDKDAELFEALGALGFGHVEVGTVTFEPQPGNPRPRLFRLPRDRALINRMGFNNHGSAAAASRLHGPRRFPVGVNLGKTKRVEEAHAITDYVQSAARIARLADYVVVNVSSPNTPGLRALQAIDKLGPLLEAVRATLEREQPSRRVPLLVKVAPDLSDEELLGVANLCVRLGLDGMVLCNTTLSRAGLATASPEVAALGAGGLSGAPLKARSLAMLERVRESVGRQLTLISVGGVETAEDVWARLEAGADLVQLYSAFVYEGPLLMWRIQRDLVDILRRKGQPSLAAAFPHLRANSPPAASLGSRA